MLYNEDTRQFDIINRHGAVVNSADDWEVALVESFETHKSPDYATVVEWLRCAVENEATTYDVAWVVADDYLDFDEGSSDWRLWCLWGFLLNEYSKTEPPDDDDIDETTSIEVDNREYRVLTDSEADDLMSELVRESLWVVSAEWLANNTELPVGVFQALKAGCESSNEAIVAIVEKCGDIDQLINDIEMSEGRGQTISGMGGHEGEEQEGTHDSYIYRIR